MLRKEVFFLLAILTISISLLFVFFNTESTPIENTESTPIENTESTPIENTESTPIENTESTPIENTESTKLPKKIIFIKSIGELGDQPTQFDTPKSMDFFNEKLYVLDGENNRIQIFSKNLDLLSVIPVEVNGAYGIAITDEYFFISESYNYIIKSFDHDGNFLDQFSVTWTRDLLSDENFIYVIEPLIQSIQVFDHDTTFIYKLEGIQNLHFLSSNDQYLVASGTHIDHDPHELLLIDKEKRVIEQRFSTSPGTTSGSAINENSIFLLDAGILKIFDFNGNLLLEYFIQIPGSDSAIDQIEINENILYVLDTRGHNIHMFEITYE
jgi:hypothetical protein